MKTQILLVILQLNKPLSTSYRSCKSSSLSFWSPNYGSNLHKGHFPSYRACCDMIHAFCLLLGIWGCLWRAVINTASNSSFHKMLYSQEKRKKKKIASRTYVISFPFPLPSGTILVASFVYISKGCDSSVRQTLWSTRCSVRIGCWMAHRHFSYSESVKMHVWRQEVE